MLCQMIQNRVIKIALKISKLILGICVLAGVAFVGFVIHWHISPKSYEAVEVSQVFKPGFGVNGFHWVLGKKASAQGLWLSDLSPLMIYWLLLRGLIFIVLSFLITQAFQRILVSIHSIETFHQNNVKQFKIIAQYGLIAFFFSFFNFSYIQGEFDINFHLATAPLLLTISSYVLAEVFREGNKLSEDQKLMI